MVKPPVKKKKIKNYDKRFSNKQHTRIIKLVAARTGLHQSIITIIIKRFFWSMTDLLKRNRDIKLRGLFRIVMTRKVRESLKTPGQKIWTRKNDKRNYKKRKNKSK